MDWAPIDDNTHKNHKKILAWCCHEADPYWESAKEYVKLWPKKRDGIASEDELELIEGHHNRRMTPYAFNAENGHVVDGIHVLEYGGGYQDSFEEGGGSGPDGWFLAGSDFEQAANPILWKPLGERGLNLLLVHMHRNEGFKFLPEHLRELAS